MDEQPKSPTGGQKTKVAYGWTDNQSRLRVDDPNTIVILLQMSDSFLLNST